jgi:PKD repeat protein
MHLATLRVDVTASSMHLEAVCGPPTTKDDMTCTQGTVIDSTTIDAADAPPEGRLAVTPNSGVAPLSVTADASGFHDDDATRIAAYRFHFGDGTATGASTSPTATHTYTSPGRYRVRVIVTDTAGLDSSDRRRVRVNAASA